MKKENKEKEKLPKKSITLDEDNKQENQEAKEKVEDGKEVGKEKETQVQEEEEDKGEEKGYCFPNVPVPLTFRSLILVKLIVYIYKTARCFFG